MNDIWGEVIASVGTQVLPGADLQDLQDRLRPIECVSIDASCVVLRAPNRYQKEWFEDNCLPAVLRELESKAGRPLAVRFEEDCSEGSSDLPGARATPARASESDSGPSVSARSAPAVVPPSLLARYTFDRFVVGPNNRFAHSAANMVAATPGQKWNPLFIYGGVGVGKTHLLHAIGHEIYRAHPDWRVVYVTCEQFVSEFIGSLRSPGKGGWGNRMDEFRTRYRESADVLLIDDIQFLSNKDSSQDEFFHTFNALHHAHKQIVMTCDRLPAEVGGLEDRLRSRFTWGLITEVGVPDLETRVAIIKSKAEREGVAIPDDVAMYLGSAVRTNVRDLEGAFARLTARASFDDAPITLALAKDALRGFLPEAPAGLTIEAIQREVANYFNVKLVDLKGPRRHRAISHPRAIAMYLARHLTAMSFPEIGNRFGGKDHSTVITAVRKIDRLIKEDAAQRSIVKTIESHLREV